MGLLDKKVILGAIAALIVTVVLIAWCHNNMACGSCKKKTTSAPPPSQDSGGYQFQNTGGAFKIMMVQKNTAAFPQTPALTLFVDATGQATASSAMTIYQPQVRRHHVRYAINPATGDENRVPVGTPNTYWCTYDTDNGLVLGLGTTPSPESTLLTADTYVPLGVFSMQVQGPGISGMQAIPQAAPRAGACRWKLKKPYD